MLLLCRDNYSPNDYKTFHQKDSVSHSVSHEPQFPVQIPAERASLLLLLLSSTSRPPRQHTDIEIVVYNNSHVWRYIFCFAAAAAVEIWNEQQIVHKALALTLHFQQNNNN